MKAVLLYHEKQRFHGRYLMDNHHPKGHHVHFDETEAPYEYVSDEKLIEDFKRFVLNHLGVAI
jgi:hypothetical protein